MPPTTRFTIMSKTDTKKPVSHKVGRGATKVTMGTLFGLGRFAAKASTGFIAGVTEAGREIKAGYDEAKAEK